ncbi:pectate lyase [Vibrio metschnikovii]|nr:pectate lyase [Vibrio metschnikovii]EKO3721357.1 pectate lyase [Vibrio metschnikovii]EKO3725770.1 pectate lyase [Vibrio metschnikovii]EKO3880640.1 pectate lyase [Vibrio metschnikovii]EKO3939576.1 pectate lyase [Vibrio metschnikovii]
MKALRTSFFPLLLDYYQRILQHARSTRSPLLADGLDSQSLLPVCWLYPDGSRVPMSNFASQQNFLRGLVALSTLTQNPAYQRQATELSQYFLTHYVDPISGLLHWGGHRFIHLEDGTIEGPASKECVHELKHHFPFYDLLHEVNPQATERFLTGFWAAHVTDWQRLDLSRHGQYQQSFPDALFSLHIPNPVVDPSCWPNLPETIGLTFVNASTDLIYAASHYFKYTGDHEAKRWAKHLYHQFVLARHPQTRMPVYQFSSPLQRQPIPEDDRLTYSWFGDRAKRQFGPEFGEIAKEANVLFRDSWPVVVDNPLAILECAKLLDDDEMATWAIEGIIAYFDYAWDEVNNEIVPMWNNGQDMTNYRFVRDGYYGDKGTQLTRQAADPAYLLPLVRAYAIHSDPTLRQLLCRMFHRFSLGALDPDTLQIESISEHSSLCSAYLLLALIELYQLNQDRRLLKLADVIAHNLIEQHYHHGFFLPSAAHRYARIDDPIPYALLALEAAYAGQYNQIPLAISKGGYLHGEWLYGGELKTVYDYEVIYNVVSAQ